MWEGNPLGVENPAIKFLRPTLSRLYWGKNFAREPSIQRVAKIAGAPWPDRGISDPKGRIGEGRVTHQDQRQISSSRFPS